MKQTQINDQLGNALAFSLGGQTSDQLTMFLDNGTWLRFVLNSKASMVKDELVWELEGR